MKLTPPQAAMLESICMTNGGGVSVYHLDQRVMRRLEGKGLIQGKLNGDGRAVHTREGLALWRSQKGPTA